MFTVDPLRDWGDRVLEELADKFEKRMQVDCGAQKTKIRESRRESQMNTA
ncbi:MAG: hypothetical protein KDC95_17610 [Planctomycetes bacterium]|nr:hypothetical protein [Planctomycetota bacterium]